MARKKIYKTRMGRTLDIETMRIENEKTIAAGNMSVNAKGDIVRGGKVVKTAKERTASRYESSRQIKSASLKKPLSQQDTTLVPTKEADTENKDVIEENIKSRNDGSEYKEIITPSGDIEHVEVEKKPKSKTTTTKKKTTPKKKKSTDGN